MYNSDHKKKLAGEKVLEYIENGMTLGLGSGSTVYWTIKKLGELVKGGLDIKGIPSSKRTEGWAKEFGVPLIGFDNIQQLHLAFDGADEVDPYFNLTKGGGGSLFREKLVDSLATKFIVIVDDSKIVDQLGKFPLPVEVVQFGWETTANKIAQLGCEPKLRIKEGKAFVTDNGNYILDCSFSSITDPAQLHQQLKQLVGVVETGLFVNMVDEVIVGEKNGARIIKK